MKCLTSQEDYDGRLCIDGIPDTGAFAPRKCIQQKRQMNWIQQKSALGRATACRLQCLSPVTLAHKMPVEQRKDKRLSLSVQKVCMLERTCEYQSYHVSVTEGKVLASAVALTAIWPQQWPQQMLNTDRGTLHAFQCQCASGYTDTVHINTKIHSGFCGSVPCPLSGQRVSVWMRHICIGKVWCLQEFP